MSDALSDIARSKRIHSDLDALQRSERQFLAMPTSEALIEVYTLARRTLNVRSAYQRGKDGIGQLVTDYYQARFPDGKAPPVVMAEDIGAYLSRLQPEDRLEELAELAALKQGGDSKPVLASLKQKLTLADYDILIGKLPKQDFERIYPIFAEIFSQ